MGENYPVVFSTIMNMILVFAIMIPLAVALYFLIKKIQRLINNVEGRAINYLHKKTSSLKNNIEAARPRYYKSHFLYSAQP